MDIVLLILKIIGIIILVLLAVLLSLILLLLLVPVRYRINGTWGEEHQLYAKVSWLLHFIHIYLSWEKSKPLIRIRILGMIIYDSERPIKERVERRRRASVFDKKEKGRVKNDINNEHKPEDIEIVGSQEQSDNKEDLMNKESLVNLDKSEDISHNIDERIPNIQEGTLMKEAYETKEFDDSINKKVKKETIFQKIALKIKSIFSKIKSFLRNIIDKIKAIFVSLAEVKRKGSLILDFLKDEINKDGFRYTYRSVRKFLKHILPREIKANIIYGTGDPCSTGQILGLVAILYSMYGEKISIIPDFEDQRFEGNAMVRGRIRLVTILIIVIKLILDRRFIQLRNNVRLLKEAL